MNKLTSEETSAYFAPGQMQRPKNTEWLATYLRASETAKGLMHVITLDGSAKPITVGQAAIRSAS